MSTIRNPVGPLPPQIYWRRRIVVGLGVLAVLIIIVLIIVRPGTGAPAEQPTPDPQSSETAEPDEPGEAPATGDAAACTPSQVTVTPVTDAEVYAAGQQPLLSLTLLNTGTTACTLQAGSDVQSYVITSGSDRIWASTDCQEPGVVDVRVLEPGEPLSTTPFAWSLTRSTPDDCATVDSRPGVVTGGATYRLNVSVGEFESADDRPFILN